MRYGNRSVSKRVCLLYLVRFSSAFLDVKQEINGLKSDIEVSLARQNEDATLMMDDTFQKDLLTKCVTRVATE